MVITTNTVEETLHIGRLLGKLAPPNTCIALDGELGAGKTHLTRGIAEGAAVDDPSLVSSPTYVLLNIYPGPKPVHHLDAYRIHSAEDLAATGLKEWLAADGIVVIEWAQKVASLLPPDHLRILIEHDGDDLLQTRRTLQFSPTGPVSKALAEQILADWRG